MNASNSQLFVKRLMRQIGLTLTLILASSSLTFLGAQSATAAPSPFKTWGAIASSDDGTKLAVGEFLGSIWTSSDSGVNWTEHPVSSSNWIAVAMSSDGTKLAAVARQGDLVTSTDSGVTWVDRSAGTGTGKRWESIASSSDGSKLVAIVQSITGTGEIWTSADSGATWTDRTTPDIALKTLSGVTSSDDGTKLAIAFKGGVLLSTDSGATWTDTGSALVLNGQDNFYGITSSADGSVLAAANFDTGGTAVIVSTDSGATWTRSPIAGSGGNFVSIASSSDGSKIVSGRYGGAIYTSADTGATWVNRNTGDYPSGRRNWRFASSSDGVKLVAAAEAGCIWTSTDSGASWTDRCESAVAPSAPGKPAGTPSNGAVDLTWAKPATGTAPMTYTITSSPAGASCVVSDRTAACTGLTNGTPYTFVVTATNSLGNADSPSSDPVTPVTPPTASAVSPVSGLVTGGTPITITGTLFAAGATVTVGGTACTDVVVVSATEITCVTPAGTAGAKNVVVTNTDSGSATLTGAFTYNAVPTIATVAPTSGTANGGTAITITGTAFVAGATVTVGGTACTDVVVVSATSITCVSPAGTTGTKDVVVTNADGGLATKAASFTYISAPTAATVSPNFGSSEGATTITITGTSFVAGVTVTVGGTACTDVVVVSATSITCVTPAGTLGAKDVVITNADGGTVTSLNVFTYNKPFRSVTFKANGGTGTFANASKNSPSALPANKLVRSGYVFKGWNTSANGTGTAYADKASYAFESDLTLYAQWSPALKQFISTFAGDRADLTMGMQKMIAVLAKKLPKKATITCVGSTSGAKVTDFDKKLASSRAKSVCAEVVKLRKDVKYTLKVNPSSSTAIASRSVWVHLK